MELRCEEVRVLMEFEDPHPPPSVGASRVREARRLELLDIVRVHLVPMTVSLEHGPSIIEFRDNRIRIDDDVVSAEAHRGAHGLHGPLLRQEVDYGMLRLRIELRAVRALEAEPMAGGFDRRGLGPRRQNDT